jgi:hypothetical protein
MTWTIDVTVKDTGCKAEMKWEAKAKVAGDVMFRTATGYTAAGAAGKAMEWLVQDLMREWRGHR